MEFRQLSRHRGLTVAKRRPQVNKCSRDSPGRLEEDQGESGRGRASEQSTSLTLAARKESQKRKRSVNEAARRNRRDESRGSGNGRNGVAGRDRGRDDRLTGIGDAGCPGIADQGDVTGLERVQEGGEPRSLVVGVITDLARLDVEMGEQTPGMARVFRRDELNSAQDA